MSSRKELEDYFKSYKIKVGSNTNDKEMQWLVNNINKARCSDKPDAYLIDANIAYGIEHFKVSMNKEDRKGAEEIKIEACVKNRDKLKQDERVELTPSLDRLQISLISNLKQHSDSFSSYEENVLQLTGCQKYRLVVFIECYSKSSYIVKNQGIQPIDPLELDIIVNPLLDYTDLIWGVIFATGNEQEKILYAYTINELLLKKQEGKLLNASEYKAFEDRHDYYVSKDEPQNDSHIVHINLFDHI